LWFTFLIFPAIKKAIMPLTPLNPLPADRQDKKLTARYARLQELLSALTEYELSAETETFLNGYIKHLNTFSGTDKQLRKALRNARGAMLQRLEKEHGLVPRNRYMLLWMSIGMAGFGIPMGVAFGAALDNMGLLGLGLPIGLAIGLSIGAGLDKKAKEEGRQLAIDSL
jgi:hypothetical protein